MTTSDTYPFIVELAAHHLGCRPDELIKWRIEQDLLVVIAPSGQKFKYTVEQVKAMAEELPEPVVTENQVDAGSSPGGPSPQISGLVTPEAAAAPDPPGGSSPRPKAAKAAKRPSR